jgi:hypothetical protein
MRRPCSVATLDVGGGRGWNHGAHGCTQIKLS